MVCVVFLQKLVEFRGQGSSLDSGCKLEGFSWDMGIF